jgi:hypothetical protein
MAHPSPAPDDPTQSQPGTPVVSDHRPGTLNSRRPRGTRVQHMHAVCPTQPARVKRVCAAGAAVLGCTAMGGLLVAAVGTPALRVSGYVSELGARGAPWAGVYRVAILAIAVGLGLLAVVYRPVSVLAAAALAVAAGFGTVSASVPCTPGCPLPPEASATRADVVHTGASIAGFVAAGVAMLILAGIAADPVARLCRYAVVLVTGLGTPVGVGIVLVGRGVFTGALERAMMAVAIGWLVGVSALAALRPSLGSVRRGYRQPRVDGWIRRAGAARAAGPEPE